MNLQVKVVNTYINRLAAVLGPNQTQDTNIWPAPREFFDSGHVNDNAYAITKYYALRALAVPENRLCLAMVYDNQSGHEHLLLVVLTDDTFYLLDNKHNNFEPRMALNSYSIRYFTNAESSWRPVYKKPLYVAEDGQGQGRAKSIYGSFAKKRSIDDYPFGKPFNIVNLSIAGQNETGRQDTPGIWKKVCDAELHEPTFSGGRLNVADAKMKSSWAYLYDKVTTGNIHAKMEAVNVFFNKIIYREDEEIWGVKEYWATPREFILKGAGDCEDYAIAKYFALRALGVPAQDMYVLCVSVPESRTGHAVLMIIDGDGFYVLDNDGGLSRIYRDGGHDAYVPVYYLNENGAWRHMNR